MKNLFLFLGLLVFTVAPPVAHAAAIVTRPGDPIGGGQLNTTTNTFTIATNTATFGTNSYPANESPPNAIDGIAGTKYLNFGGANTGYIVTPTLGRIAVGGINFTTGNDGPERDPLTFSLYGSNTQVASTVAGTVFSLTDFTQIVLNQSTGLTTDPGRLASIPTIVFPTNGSYQTYLLVFPTIRNATLTQIGNAILVTPEPGLTLLLGLGGLGLASVRRRRRAI